MEGVKKEGTWPKTVDTPTRGKNLPVRDIMGGEEKPKNTSESNNSNDKESAEKENSHIIDLEGVDEKIVSALKEKLEEYKKRLEDKRSAEPNKAPEFFYDLRYKIIVLEELLENGKVDTYSLADRLSGKDGSIVSPDDFNNACGVIEDYVKTGGKENVGGTGLNSDKKTESGDEAGDSSDENTGEGSVTGDNKEKTKEPVDLYKEAREEYNSHSKKVREAQKKFVEAMDEYRSEYQNSGFMKHFMSTEELDEKEFNMLKAQDEYDKLLDGLRGLREKRVTLFAEKLSKKAEKEGKSVSKLEKATSYIARHEAILERQIDHEVELLESLKSKKGDKEDSKNEAKNRLLRGMKAGWNWYRGLTPKQRLAYSTALAAGVGAVMGASGVIAGGVMAGVATKAGRRIIGGTLGAAAAGVTKRTGDAIVNKYEEHKKKELKEVFSEESLGKSRRERLALNKKVKIGKHVATGAAAASAFAVGMEVSKIGTEVVDAVTGGGGGAHDAVESAVSAKHDAVESATKNGVVEKTIENSLSNKEFAKNLANADVRHGGSATVSESGASVVEKGSFHIGDSKLHEELAKRLGIDTNEMHAVKENGVLTINGKPVSDELLSEYLTDEQMKHFKMSGHFNKMMNDASHADKHVQTERTYVSDGTDDDIYNGKGVIESDKENIDPRVYESEAKDVVDKTSKIVGADGEVVHETFKKTIEGDAYSSPYEEYLDKGYEHGPQVDDLLEKFGIEKVELKSTVPHDLSLDTTAHLGSKPELKFEGIYEHGSSIERELQGFLKDNDWIKEKYPDLTDVERGKIAHRLGLKILSDKGSFDELKVRGGNPDLVWEGDKYSMDIDKDVVEKEIEAIHGGGRGEVEVLHDSAKEPVSTTHPYEDNDSYEKRIPTTSDVDDGVGAETLDTTDKEPASIAHPYEDNDSYEKRIYATSDVDDGVAGAENGVSVEHKTLESDLESATEKLMEQKVDYQGLATRPIVESLFKDKFFDGVISGQRPMILSNWGPISHARLQDVFDGEGKLTYTIGGETIEMGADAENLTLGIVNQLERNLSGKVPNIDEIISQGRENNITIGDLMKKISSEIEKNSSNVISDNAEVVEKVSDVQDAGVAEHPDIADTHKAEVSTDDIDKHIDSIHKEPLDKYYENAKPELAEAGVGKYATILAPIDVSKGIENYVDKIYLSKHPEWATGNAKILFESDSAFRESLNSELQDIKIELTGGKDIDFSNIDVDWSKYENMTAKDALEQMEQHKEMLRKINVDYKAPSGIKKFTKIFTRK